MSRALLLPALAATLLAPVAVAPRAAVATEKNASCGHNIVSLPTTANAPGTWCLTGNLTTSATTGAAITITANDVVLDCNGFRIDDYSADDSTTMVGVLAENRRNITVRNCDVRGFRYGTFFDEQSNPASGRHLLEDNVFRNSRYIGIHLGGDGSMIRRNRVLDTRAPSSGGAAFAINTLGDVDIVDNSVHHVEASNAAAAGILVNYNDGGSVRGNRVENLGLDSGTGPVWAIQLQNSSARVSVRGNVLAGQGVVGTVGISCVGTNNAAKSNSILGYPNAIEGCTNHGNIIKP